MSGLFLAICAIVGTLTINANANAAVSGKVTDSNGRPVEGAHITFTSEPDASQHYSDVTDTDGMYHVTLGIFTAVEAESGLPLGRAERQFWRLPRGRNACTQDSEDSSDAGALASSRSSSSVTRYQPPRLRATA